MFHGRPSLRGRAAGVGMAVLLTGLLLLPWDAAFATTFRDRPVDCPVCTKRFTAVEVRSTNTFGGYDSDLCVHANGAPPSDFRVWTCPSCRYSARAGSFAKGVSEATRRRILAGWPEAPAGIPANVTQGAIPAWKKYELAGRILDEEKAEPADRLRLWRDAAFAERCASPDSGALDAVRSDPVLGPRLDAALDRIGDLRRELPSDVDGRRTRSGADILAAREILAGAAKAPPAERRILQVAAGTVLRVRGALDAAAAALRGVEKDADGEPLLREAARDLLAGIGREKGYLERAFSIVRLPPGELGKLVLDGEPAARTGWTAAESFRRLGDDEQAGGWLRAALGSTGARDWMFALAREVLAVEGACGPRWTAAAREACAGWERRLLDRLRDPEAGEEAAAVLARLGDAALVPALLAALVEKDGPAAPFAAAALGGYAEPGAEAERALESIVADEDADPEVRWRAVEALLALAPESAGPAFLSAAGGSAIVREAALRGLGRTGEADAVPVLLAAAAEEPDIALPALSLLAGRDLPDAAGAAAWWEKNRGRTRAEWTREVFREAGTEIPAPPDGASVPRLVELLGSPSLPVRWAAFRALRSLSGRSLGRREILDEGRIHSPTEASAPFTMEEVFGEGRVIMDGPLPEYDIGEFLGKVSPRAREDQARPARERAQALWLRWERDRGGR